MTGAAGSLAIGEHVGVGTTGAYFASRLRNDAFCRIGSVFILNIVSRALAWWYHRQASTDTENA